jgi:hypothetical protein
MSSILTAKQYLAKAIEYSMTHCGQTRASPLEVATAILDGVGEHSVPITGRSSLPCYGTC